MGAGGIQGDFFPDAGQWKTSDMVLMKIFDLTNERQEVHPEYSFHGCYFYFILFFC